MKRTLLFLVLLGLAGCSTTSFVGRRVDNFTAYYNTFYNAKRAYSEGVKAMQQQDRPIDRDTYLLVFDPGNRGAGTQNFENAIKKSADILRGHPDSKWVDDALLLIGKSYYHLDNTVGAQQKFREVIDTSADLGDEARFWLGMTLITGGSLDEAAAHFQASLERENVPRKWASRMQLALGSVYVRQERWSEAAEQLVAGAARVNDDVLGSRGQYLLGQVLETLGEYDRAAEAYRDVDRFKPAYELSYAAKFNAVRVEGEYGDAGAALDALRKMERDDKNFAYRAELTYLRGRVLKAAGRSEDAVFTFYDVLYNSDGNISTVRGKTHYQLGLLYRDQFIDYDLAAAHFDTASTAMGGGRRPNPAGRAESVAPAPYAIGDAPELAEIFGNYADFHSEVNHYDSLLTLGMLDDEAFDARIEEIRVQMAEQILEERREQERRAAEAGFRGAGIGDVGRAGATPRPSGAAGGDYATAGFLYHRDRSRVQDGLLNFFDRWGERPRVPNWRRGAAIAAAGRTAETEEGEEADESQVPLTQPVAGNLAADALLSSVEVDISEIPRTAERQAEMRRQRSAARYELANVLFLSIGLPDSAAAWYRMVLDESDDPEVSARALYALAEVQQSLGDQGSAATIYRDVLERYPDSEVAVRAAQRLGLQDESTGVSGTAGLSERYQTAFDRWLGGSFSGAMEDMLSLAAAFPDSSIAGRALLASGAIYADWAEVETRDLLEPIGVDVADSIWIALGLKEPVEATQAATADSAGSEQLAPDDVMNEAPGDSLVTTSTPEDDISAEPDSVHEAAPVQQLPSADALPDSLAVPGPAVADSVDADMSGGAPQAEKIQDVFLRDIYNLVTTRYPGSDYARRATQLAGVLDERQAVRDSIAAAALEAVAIRDTVSVDSVAGSAEELRAPAGFPAEGATLIPADDAIPDSMAVEARPGAAPADSAVAAPDSVAQAGPVPAAADPDTTVYNETDTPVIPVGGAGTSQRLFRYPASAAADSVTGLVTVEFVVDESGRVVAPAAVTNVGAGCEEEAVRVARMIRYRPATVAGRPVRVRTALDLRCEPRSDR